MNKQLKKAGQWPGGGPSDACDDHHWDPSRGRLAGDGRPAPVSCAHPAPFGGEQPRLTNKKRILDESSESTLEVYVLYSVTAANMAVITFAQDMLSIVQKTHIMYEIRTNAEMKVAKI